MLIRRNKTIKLDSTYKRLLDPANNMRLARRLTLGRFYSPMQCACLTKGGMGVLRFYRIQPHETWMGY